MRARPLRLILGLLVFIGAGVVTPAGTGAATADQYFDYLQSLYNSQDTKLAEYLDGELVEFILLYPESAHVGEARYLRARIATSKRDEQRGFLLFMKTLYLDPAGETHKRAAEGARVIVTTNKLFQDKKNELIELINGEFPAGSPVDLHYAYLDFLQGLDLDKLRRWSIVEYQEFCTLYPDEPRAERVQYWTAGMYADDGDEREAAASYLKFEKLYPQSNLVPAVRILRAEILNDKLKKPEQAMATLTAVIEEYPRTGNAGTALYERADIKASRFKDYAGAVADYELLVAEMPQHARAADALMQIGQIDAKRRKDYSGAVAAYDELAAQYPANRKSIEALEEAGNIYLNKLRQPVSAAERYAKIADLFPDDENSPDMLMKAAKICRKDAKRPDQALVYYERVVAQYPTSEQATKARKEITKLQQQPGG